ncbi:hypothetical protein [Tenacibaculum phage Larrie]|nr:hypothetical protein [Tenacibaculum phage Larrie]
MVLLIKSIHDLLDDSLSVEERGLLVTLALVKEKDKKLTLAKFKAKVKFTKYKSTLLSLHKRGFIKLSNFDKLSKEIKKNKIYKEVKEQEVKEVVDFMNKLLKRRFGYTSKDFYSNLVNRISEHGVENCKKVVANRYAVWKDDPVMRHHLEPSTIFRPSKFVKYLREVEYTKQGSSFIEADKIDLKKGDVITFEVSKTLVDEDVYNIKTYQSDSEGNRRGSGMAGKRYGKDIKRLVLLQENQRKHGLIEYIYCYDGE